MGCLTLAFAAFQLWGTGFAEDRAQSSLQSEFEAQRAAFAAFADSTTLPPATTQPEAPADTAPTTTVPGDRPIASTTVPPTTVPPVPAESVPEELLPRVGDALGVIRIPKINVDKVVVAGTRRDDLRKGPGHYVNTPLPGQSGNAAIAGHRTTYGAPFGDLDLLVPGDQIIVETFQGTFNYEVLPVETTQGVSGHSIVTPFDVQVLDDYGDNRLTLTACHPKYSARQRIVVQARLVNPPAATIELAGLDDIIEDELTQAQLAYEATGVDPVTGERTDEFDPTIADPNGESDVTDPQGGSAQDEGNVVGTTSEALDESLGWHMEELTPFLLWSILTALAAAVAYVVARRWKKWPSYGLATPVVLTLLFFSFTHLDRMLPAF